MSLDLYIESNTPVLHRGTGVYIRKNGETRELETKHEVLTYFPDVNPDDVKETTYEDNTYFHMNMTHNLNEMADKCISDNRCSMSKAGGIVTLYDLLWRPDENLDITVPNMEYLESLMSCYKNLLNNPKIFKKYNPDNGWGSYEQLLNNTKKYIGALHSISTDFENYKIVASR